MQTKKIEGKAIKTAQQLEVEELLQKAEEKVGHQLVIGNAGDLQTHDEIKHFALGNLPDDPDKKHDVYYKGIEKLLRRYLPTGDLYKEVRDAIREEKNIFLTRGKKLDKTGRRGGDSRFAPLSEMEDVMNLIANWATNNGNYMDLYNLFYEKNKTLGYHSQKE